MNTLVANNVIGLSQAASLYADAYFTLFAKLSDPMKERVLKAKGDESNKDKDVIIFVRQVVELAENPPKPVVKSHKQLPDIK